MTPARWTALLSGVLLVALAERALCQAGGDVDLRSFTVPTDPEATLALEPSTTPGSGNWNAGAWASYAHAPLTVVNEDGDERRLVTHQVSVDYLANVGLGSRLALGLVLPTVAYQTGAETADGETVAPTALGDLALAGKATILAPHDFGGLGVALLGRVSAPTATSGTYVGERGPRGGGSLLGELGLFALTIRASAGARFRGARDALEGALVPGHDLPWAVGLSLRPQVLGLDYRGRWRWNVEARGAVALEPRVAERALSPALAALSARYTVSEFSAIAGVELPLNDAWGSPLVRPVLGVGWAPRFEDEDGDGIEDSRDECPADPEDFDGVEDHDGCPEPAGPLPRAKAGEPPT
jgi:OmpA-OmpF porin, OOP family